MKHNLIFKIVFCAIMAALAISLERFSIRVSVFFKITFYALPLLMVGLTNGVKLSLITGLVSGFLMQLLSPYGITITTFFWMLAPISWSLVASLCMKIKIKNTRILILILVIIASISSTFLNTFAMFMDLLLINDSYYTTAMIITNLPTRLINMVLLILPYYVICLPLYDVYMKLDLQNKHQKQENEN